MYLGFGVGNLFLEKSANSFWFMDHIGGDATVWGKVGFTCGLGASIAGTTFFGTAFTAGLIESTAASVVWDGFLMTCAGASFYALPVLGIGCAVACYCNSRSRLNNRNQLSM